MNHLWRPSVSGPRVSLVLVLSYNSVSYNLYLCAICSNVVPFLTIVDCFMIIHEFVLNPEKDDISFATALVSFPVEQSMALGYVSLLV